MDDTGAPEGGQGTRNGTRARKAKEGPVPKERNGTSDTETKAVKHQLPAWSIRERQYAGAHVAVLGSVVCVTSYAQSAWSPKVQVLAGLFLALIGLFLHETRPYRRRGYGDLMDHEKTS